MEIFCSTGITRKEEKKETRLNFHQSPFFLPWDLFLPLSLFCKLKSATAGWVSFLLCFFPASAWKRFQGGFQRLSLMGRRRRRCGKKRKRRRKYKSRRRKWSHVAEWIIGKAFPLLVFQPGGLIFGPEEPWKKRVNCWNVMTTQVLT